MFSWRNSGRDPIHSSRLSTPLTGPNASIYCTYLTVSSLFFDEVELGQCFSLKIVLLQTNPPPSSGLYLLFGLLSWLIEWLSLTTSCIERSGVGYESPQIFLRSDGSFPESQGNLYRGYPLDCCSILLTRRPKGEILYAYGHMFGKYFGNPAAKTKSGNKPATFYDKGDYVELKVEHFRSKQKRGIACFTNFLSSRI